MTVKISAFEEFFRDPAVGENGLLEPGMSGTACENVRHALRRLGYQVEFGEECDVELAKAVLQFQEDNGHPSRDGKVGPGTRRLLIQKLLEKGQDSIFDRMRTPEKHDLEKELAHYNELLKASKKRLKTLELKAAQLGSAAPHQVITELEEIQRQTQIYRARIDRLKKLLDDPTSELDAIDAELAEDSALQLDDDHGYALAAVRGLLLAAFKAESLRSFLYYRPRFRPIVDSFGPGHGFDDMVDQVIEYCERHCLLEELLGEVENHNPEQYQRWVPHVHAESTDD